MDIEWLYLTTVYLLLVIASAIAQMLYYRAYIEMKRTPIIKSLLLVLTSILLENIYFLCLSVARGYQNGHMIVVMENPIAWSIPKVFMLYAVTDFIHKSTKVVDSKEREIIK